MNIGLRGELNKNFDDHGHGFISFFFQENYRPMPKGVSITLGKGWKTYDMNENNDQNNVSHIAPSGHAVYSDIKGAKITVNLDYTTELDLELFFMTEQKEGAFRVEVSGGTDTLVKFNNASRETKSLTIDNIPSGSQTITLTLISGKVTLYGFQAKLQLKSKYKYSVVHNWGNGWTTSKDWANIDSLIFVTGVQALQPDVAVVLLGTNDHLRNISTGNELKANIKTIVSRLQVAGMRNRILIVSTSGCGSCKGNELLKEYAETSLPEAAVELNEKYWDMYTWFGIKHPVHFNKEEGIKIGKEMFKVINEKLRAPVDVSILRPIQYNNPFLKSINFQFGDELIFPDYANLAKIYDPNGRLLMLLPRHPGIRNVLPEYRGNSSWGYVVFN